MVHISACIAMLIIAMLAFDCTKGRIRQLLKSQKLVGVNLSGRDFYNLDLPGINLTRARLVRTSLTFCNFRKGKFVNADMRLADLSAADLSEADLRGASLRGAKCHNAIFRKAVLIDAYFYDADLSGSDLREAVMSSVTPDGSGVPIPAERIPGTVPHYVHFRNADLSGAAVSAQWKDFIRKQGVRNFDNIIWAK
jgi:uncharacterized protein YjbI with pentapeptide repeats